MHVSRKGICEVTGNSQFKSPEAGAYLIYLRNSEATCVWRGMTVSEQEVPSEV